MNTDFKLLVLPTRQLRDLLVRAVRARRVKWNYANCFQDVRGFGIQLAVAEWCTKQNTTYINR